MTGAKSIFDHTMKNMICWDWVVNRDNKRGCSVLTNILWFYLHLRAQIQSLFFRYFFDFIKYSSLILDWLNTHFVRRQTHSTKENKHGVSPETVHEADGPSVRPSTFVNLSKIIMVRRPWGARSISSVVHLRPPIWNNYGPSPEPVNEMNGRSFNFGQLSAVSRFILNW